MRIYWLALLGAALLGATGLGWVILLGAAGWVSVDRTRP